MSSDSRDPILPGPKTEAAKQSRRRFECRVEEQLKQEGQIVFDILVWGMSIDRDAPIARKRKEIRNQLIDEDHNVMVSEELTNVGSDFDLSQASRELAQAREADFIIVLIEGSPGALAAVCDFCVRTDIASKVYIMAPHSYRDGYPGKGDLQDLDKGYGVVYWYRQEDVAACNLLKQACMRVQARRSLAYRDQPGRTN